MYNINTCDFQQNLVSFLDVSQRRPQMKSGQAMAQILTQSDGLECNYHLD